MPDIDSRIVINMSVYKAAIEAAKMNKQPVSEFLEEAINNSKKLKTYKEKYDALLIAFNKKYQLLAQSIPLGILIIQSKKVQFANDYFYKMFGYSKGEINNIYSILSKSSKEKLKRQLDNNQQISDFELEAKSKNNHKLFLYSRLFRIQYSGKTAFILILKDVSHKKNIYSFKSNIEDLKYYLKEKDEEIENLKKKLNEKLKEFELIKKKKTAYTIIEEPPKFTEEKKVYRKPIEKTPLNSLIILTDKEGNISSINSQVTLKLGYKLEDFFDEEGVRSINMEDILAEDKTTFKKWIEEVNLTRKPILKEVTVRDKQKRKKKFSIMMELITDIDSEPIGIINIIF